MGDQEKLIQFVTWLGENVPELKGKAPEQIVEAVNELSSSEEGQQMLQGLIKEFESSTMGVFKKGGKLEYLLCLKSGGSVQDCGCGCKKIRKGQDGLSEIKEETTPSYSRRDAMNAAMDNKFSRSQARFAYQGQKNALRRQGFRGAEMRQAARRNIVNTFSKPESPVQSTQEPVDNASTPASTSPNTQSNPFSTFNVQSALQTVADIKAKANAQPTLPTLNTDINIDDEPLIINNDTFTSMDASNPTVGLLGSFDSAFAQSRKKGLDKFYYSGPDKKEGWYTTELATTTPGSNNNGFVEGAREQNQQRSSVNQDVVGSAIQAAKTAPKWYQRLGNAFSAGILANNMNIGSSLYQKGGTIKELPQEPVVYIEQYPYASKQDAIAAAEQIGLTGANARRAYGDSKKFMRKHGLRGNDLRQAARYNLIDMAYPRAGMTNDESLKNLLDKFTTKISYD